MPGMKTWIACAFAAVVVLFQCPLFGAASEAEINNLIAKYEKLQDAGRFDEAIPLAKQVLKLEEDLRGPNHLDTAVAANNLAELYRSKGDFASAEPLYK